MLYDIHHRTLYTYDEPVSISSHLARLSPRCLATQNCVEHEVKIEPPPASRHEHEDYFGNKAVFFAMRGAHKSLEVSARSRVQVQARFWPQAQDTPPWEMIRDACRADVLSDDALAGEFCFASPLITPGPMFSAYAALSFTSGTPVMTGALNLMNRLHQEFAFDPKATDVATPVEDAFNKRRGVCQDFAHIFIACVRSIGLPVRYVSGYLETLPPPGRPKLVGADASHAWASVWCGAAHGWVDMDPTNNCIPGERHLIVALGRDFSDVSPLRGVVYGAESQKLKVEVDVTPVLG